MTIYKENDSIRLSCEEVNKKYAAKCKKKKSR